MESKRMQVPIGAKFTRWTVVGFSHISPQRTQYWLCECDCGTGRAVNSSLLTAGRKQSCGCLRNEERSKNATVHGKSETPLHQVWTNMKQRCLNSNHPAFHRYGGRGISVCAAWMEFAGFATDMASDYASGLTLDRINNDGGYDPTNCRWVTMAHQGVNRANNVRIETSRGVLAVSEIARLADVDWKTIQKRLAKGIQGEQLFAKRLPRTVNA